MRTYLPRLVLFAGFFLVALIGAVTFLAAGKLALHVNPAAGESHFSGFIVAVSSLAVAVASAFPVFGHAMPRWLARLNQVWPERESEQP